jgi:hypothetical protein
MLTIAVPTTGFRQRSIIITSRILGQSSRRFSRAVRQLAESCQNADWRGTSVRATMPPVSSRRGVAIGAVTFALLACGRTNLPGGERAEPAPDTAVTVPSGTAGRRKPPVGTPEPNTLGGGGGDAVDTSASGAGGADTGDDAVIDIPAAQSGSRLRAEFLVTPNGDQVFQGFYDSERGESCALRFTSDGQYCLPLDVATTRADVRDGRLLDFRQYSDANCERPIYWAAAECENKHEPRYVVSTVERYVEHSGPGSFCVDRDWEIRELGAIIRPQLVYYRDAAGECLSTTSRSGEEFFEESEPLPREAFVAVHEEVRAMPSRLRARELVGSDGARQLLGWFDAERHEPCAFALAADLTPRCLPSFQAYGGFFSDADCSVPAAHPDIQYLAGVCGAGPLNYAMRSVDADSKCVYGMEYFAAGAALPMGTPIRDASGPCPAQPWRITSAADTFIGLGESIPAQAFVRLETAWVGAGRLRQ